MISHLFKKSKLFSFKYTFQSLLVLRNSTESFKLKRSHFCGKLNEKNVGDTVTICGWLQTVRYSKFLILRDLHGHIQVNLDEAFFQENKLFSTELLTNESVLAVNGIVELRPLGRDNKSMNTGRIEIKAKIVEVLNKADSKLPFTISQFNRANETVRLQYRYLDLRFDQMQKNLITRSNFVYSCRQFLHKNGFIDIETPTLFRRTPGGAREFIVPTKLPQQFYSLTQSPQQFKQLLMIAGFDKYYQIARCYRDESTKPDRQPEFTQIDLEMSFIDEKDCMQLVESLIKESWPFDLDNFKFPFKKMKFNDCMRFYGIDKPDLRFDMKFNKLNEVFVKCAQTGVNKLDSLISSKKFDAYAFKVPIDSGIDDIDLEKVEKEYRTILKNSHINSQDVNLFFILKNESGNNLSKYFSNEIKETISRFLQVDNEVVILMVSNNEKKMQEILGKYRLRLADLIDETNKSKFGSEAKLLRNPKIFNFLWVTDFPLFTINEETNILESTHHPFTAPIDEHVDLVWKKECLESVTGQHYDLVLNGEEIAGGSIRIHDSKLQRHVLENILHEKTEQLDHLLKALSYGAPPHGGIALGLDRLCSIMCETANIRDVIAFPKSQNGKDLMALAPAKVPDEDLIHYKIKCLE